MPAIKLGLLCWNQNTDWRSLHEAGVRADRLGYDSLWAWDHLYPIVGDPDCLLYTSPSPRDMRRSRMPSSA